MKQETEKFLSMPGYLLGKVPNTADGQKLWELLLKYRNPRFALKRRGNGPRAGRHAQSVPLSDATHFRVYALDRGASFTPMDRSSLYASFRERQEEKQRLVDQITGYREECDGLTESLALASEQLDAAEAEIRELRVNLDSIPRTVSGLLRESILRRCAAICYGIGRISAGIEYRAQTLGSNFEWSISNARKSKR